MNFFLDESGDLGFDFTKPKTSKFFVITLLVSDELRSVTTINKAVGRVLTKINHQRKKNFVNELKSTETNLITKKYFLDKIVECNWHIYSIVINKKLFRMPKDINQSAHLYNYIAASLLGKIKIDDREKIVITVDKCKTKKEILDFNNCIETVFHQRLVLNNSLIIKHKQSCTDKMLQAVDLFSNGIYSKYEHGNFSWYDCFRGKIRMEEIL
jgi:hypothetical protein